MKWGRFSQKALDFIDHSNAWLNFAHGSVRSSKTINCTVRWLDFLETGPDGLLFMIGKTKAALKRNVLDDIEDTVGRRNFRWIDKSDGLLRLCGRKVYVIGANDERAEEKIRGATIAGFYGDEVSLYPESFFNMLVSRLSIEDAKGFCNTNPDSPFHWLYVNYIINAGILDKSVFHFTMDDNPNLSESYKRNLASAYSGLWKKRMIDGLWVMAEGAIYDMFDETRHVKADIPNDYDDEWISIDYGTANPTVFLHQGKRNNDVFSRREYYFDSREAGYQKTDGEYAKDLNTFTSGRRIQLVVDPSAASFILELERNGWTVNRANNAVLDGIRSVSQLFNENRYFIHPSCKMTIQEKSSYIWDPKEQKKGIDAPLKVNDHASDAEKYGIMYGLYGPRPWTSEIDY